MAWQPAVSLHVCLLLLIQARSWAGTSHSLLVPSPSQTYRARGDADLTIAAAKCFQESIDEWCTAEPLLTCDKARTHLQTPPVA
jgi:hypothetical protein